VTEGCDSAAWRSYPQWVVADQSDAELLPGQERVRGERGLLLWLVEAVGLLEEVDAQVVSVVGHGQRWLVENWRRWAAGMGLGVKVCGVNFRLPHSHVRRYGPRAAEAAFGSAAHAWAPVMETRCCSEGHTLLGRRRT
jgi:hypothetical protein